MIPAPEGLERLRDGNRRFVDGRASTGATDAAAQRVALAEGQEPFAVVLGCSDSRVPAELVFDQGLGDLFVIRVAGNIVAPSGIGSVEFAVERFGTSLVVVLGHTGCGAVDATISELTRPVEDGSPNLRSIVDRIKPVIEPLLDVVGVDDRDGLMTEGVRANVRASVSQLRNGSPILQDLIASDALLVVGAEYALETGVVTFLDEASKMSR